MTMAWLPLPPMHKNMHLHVEFQFHFNELICASTTFTEPFTAAPGHTTLP